MGRNAAWCARCVPTRKGDAHFSMDKENHTCRREGSPQATKYMAAKNTLGAS